MSYTHAVANAAGHTLLQKVPIYIKKGQDG